MIELEMNDQQMEYFNSKMNFVKQNLRGKLDQDDLARICHMYSFNEQLIDKKLETYLPEKKYEGLEAFEWNRIETRAEKEAAKRKKIELAERKKHQQQRRQEMEERKAKRALEQEEREKAKKERAEAAELRKKEREEKKAKRDAEKAAKAEALAEQEARAE